MKDREETEEDRHRSRQGRPGRPERSGRSGAAPSGIEAAKHVSAREIYRDHHLWALDKPPGILSHPNPPATEAPNALFRAPYDAEAECYVIPGGGKPTRIWLIHRLDQETSGLILCAFDEEVALSLKEALLRREIVKEYRAVLLGAPEPRRGEWRDRLEKRRGAGRVTVTRGQGEPNAITRCSVLKVFEPSGLAHVALHPETGRTHQLRVQAALRGIPVAGDDRYGDFTANRFLEEAAGLKRMFLHAYHLELRHPVTGHALRLHAPFTSKLADPLRRMEEILQPVPRRSPAERDKARGGKGGGRGRRRR